MCIAQQEDVRSSVPAEESLGRERASPLSKAENMKQIITAKLKLLTTPEQGQALRQTQLAYRDALNAVSRYAFEQGKTSNVTRLHRRTARATSLSRQKRAKPIACTHNGPLPSYRRSSATKPRSAVH